MNTTTETIGEFALLDQLSTAVLLLDDALRIVYVNAAGEQLLGASASRTIGRRLTQVVTLSDELLTRMRESLEHGQPFTDRRASFEPRGHDQKLVDCAITPYSTQRLSRGLLIEIDAIDRPLRIARDEAILSQQEHARSLLRGLAHEVKNPLGGLRGAQVNVHEVLEHVRKITLVGAPSGVNITFDYDPSIPEFHSDRDRLVQVLLNIAGNAINAIGPQGNIVFKSRVISSFTIGSERHPLVAALEIRDDGPGVPEHLMDQIFYPMVSGTDIGSGLGLSIAQNIMNQLGGLIECQSEPGNTVFTVLTPLEIV